MGVAPEQSVLARHCTQRWLETLHRGVAPEHVESSTHSTHSPVVAQAARRGSACLHWAPLPHGTQVALVESQMGLAAGQLALTRHCTHRLLVTLQTGVAFAQVASSTHCTQAPLLAQAG